MNPLAFGALCLLIGGAAPVAAQGGRGGRAGGGSPRLGGSARPDRDPGARRPGVDRDSSPKRPERGNRSEGVPDHSSGRDPDRAKVQRHRDRDGDGRPDRHHRFRPRIWWPYYFGGFGPSSIGFGSPYFDPFYSGFYHSNFAERDEEDGKTVTVRVKPESARVTVNGLLYSAKGKASFNLPVGSWTVEISAPGYRTEVVNLNVEQGVRYRIERVLEKDHTVDPRGKPLKVEELPLR